MKPKIIEIKCSEFDECDGTKPCKLVISIMTQINVPGDEVRCLSNKESTLDWAG